MRAETTKYLPLLALALLASASVPAGAAGLDSAWLTGSYWDDGKAEVAFYRVERNRDQYGQGADQSFLVGTYLVKHEFDRQTQAKASSSSASPVSAFKSALFYEIESGAFQYKRSWVTNAAQADLEPLKASFASFDWCSNLYRELAFWPDGSVDALMRSDDYGNRAESFARPPSSYPVAELPLVVRALDFSSSRSQGLRVLLEDGRTVTARAALAGKETLETEAGAYETEKVTVSYDEAVPSPIGEKADTVEHYWRSTGPGRLLVKLEAESGRYRMTLVEALRSAYWRDNFFPRLKNVKSRP